MLRGFGLCLALCVLPAHALVQKVSLIKSNAFFEENKDNDLFQPLDLKRKKITFRKSDVENCQLRMVRVKDTLHYTCTLALPETARISRRQNQLTPVVMTIPYAGADRKVFITVSPDARQVTYSTEFDTTGFDLDIAKFNDDFYRVYGRTALNVINEAMNKTLQLEVLESHE